MKCRTKELSVAQDVWHFFVWPANQHKGSVCIEVTVHMAFTLHCRCEEQVLRGVMAGSRVLRPCMVRSQSTVPRPVLSRNLALRTTRVKM
ncbi:hypothetical protein E2C01_058460 [Portunus trituberculatus]|uniref:Uncharacterized protein n=1 Tax=Portunus trituberculatus TaxID=210409 RepID=A0A5B7H385_PORTR|nr:hypothetical protein [Portunus trituberculatus]